MKKWWKTMLLALMAVMLCLSFACGEPEKDPGDEPGDDPGDDPAIEDPYKDYDFLEFADGDVVVLKPGDIFRLKLEGSEETLTFSSSDAAIVEVDGIAIIVRKGGEVTVTANAGDAKRAELEIQVKQPVTGVGFAKENIQMIAGNTYSLPASVTPENADNKKVVYISDNPAAVTVDEIGLLTGVAAGDAKITATTEDGGKTAIANVKVLSLERNLGAWSSQAMSSESPALGYREGKDGFTDMVYMSSDWANLGMAYSTIPYRASKGVKLSLEFLESCCDQSWFISVALTNKPKAYPGYENYQDAAGVVLVIRNWSDFLQIQGDKIVSGKADHWAEGGYTPFTPENMSAEPTVFRNAKPTEKGMVIDFVNDGTTKAMTVTNPYDETKFMRYDLTDDILAGLTDDIYVTIQFNVQTSFEPVGVLAAKLEGEEYVAPDVPDVSEIGDWKAERMSFAGTSTEENLAIKFKTAGDAPVTATAKNAKFFDLAKGLSMSLGFDDNYLKLQDDQYFAVILTNDAGDGVALIFRRGQGEPSDGNEIGNAFVAFSAADYSKTNGITGPESLFTFRDAVDPANEYFYYGNSTRAFFDLSLAVTEGGIRAVCEIAGNPWYSNHFDFTEEQTARFAAGRVNVGLMIYSAANTTELDHGEMTFRCKGTVSDGKTEPVEKTEAKNRKADQSPVFAADSAA